MGGSLPDGSMFFRPTQLDLPERFRTPNNIGDRAIEEALPVPSDTATFNLALWLLLN